jgi:hypothetical protein
MSYANSHRAQSITRRGISLAVVVALGLSLPLHAATAQIGGLVKRATKKAADQQVEKQVDKRVDAAASSDPGAPPKFDDVTVELTNDRVSQIIRGLAAGRAVLDGANGAPSRAALVARRDDAARKSAELSESNAKAFDAYYQKRDASERCRNDAISASRDKKQAAAEQRQKEFQQKAMSDPAFREKAMAVAQKLATAQQKGDTAEMKRLMAELGGVADDPKADSLAADKACGAAPAKPAAMAQVEQLDAQARKLTDEIRQLEEKSADTEVKESGLNERQFHMARERIEAYLSAVKYKSQPRGFSAGELQALGARRADLEKVM